MKLKWKSGNVPEPWLLPTNSYGLNRALGGGLKSGRFHLFAGPKASTKSTNAMWCIASAQEMGKRCAYIDTEKTWDSKYAIECGIDIDSLMFADEGTNIAEELLELVIPEVLSRNIQVLVIDSLSMVSLEQFLAEPAAGGIGIDSRSSKFVLHKLLNAINKEIQVIMIAHSSYQKVGQNFMLKAAIGTKAEHVLSTIVEFTANEGTNNFRDDNAQKVRWKIRKAKQACWPLTGEYYFKKSPAEIDTYTEIADIAKECGLVTGAAWLQHRDSELKWHGMAAFAGALKNDPKLLNMFIQDIAQDDGYRTLARYVESENESE